MSSKGRGLSLLEVLLGSLIFSFTFVGMAGIWRFHELSLQKFRNHNAARFLLEQEMERITALPYILLEVGTQERSVEMIRTVDEEESRQPFELSTEILENDEETLKTVVAEVRFTERNEERSLRLLTRRHRGS